MNTDATAKIAMIQGSMRCFVFGLLGLLPFIGVPFSVLALYNAGRGRVPEKKYWNPARSYRLCGEVCAALGAIIWILVGMVILWNLSTGGWNNDN